MVSLPFSLDHMTDFDDSDSCLMPKMNLSKVSKKNKTEMKLKAKLNKLKKNHKPLKKIKTPKLITNGKMSTKHLRPTTNGSTQYKKKPENDDDDDDDEPPQLVELPPNTETENPIEAATDLFKWLIHPIDPHTFFNTFWEQKPLHIKRADPAYSASIFTSSQFDKIVRHHHLQYGRNVDVVAYENGEKRSFNQEGRAVASALWDYYANGCSIRLLNPHTYAPRVHLLLAALQERFGAMAGANVYLTPPGAQGFAPHHDDIEAFVVQLEGRKHWRIYEPAAGARLARFSSPNLSADRLGAPSMELTLNAGEVLYFPRGTVHEGRTDADAHSLHITVSVYQTTAFVDLLERLLPSAIQKAAELNVEYRKGLPIHYLKRAGLTAGDPRSGEQFKKRVQTLVEGLVQYLDVDGAVDQLGRKLMRDSMPPVLSENEFGCSVQGDGAHLKNGKVSSNCEIEPDTKIRLIRYYCCRIVKEGDVIRLYYNTENAKVYHGEEEQSLIIDDGLVAGVGALQHNYPKFVRVQDLPIEDETVKLQLVADLWERGLIITDEPLVSFD